MEDNPAQKPDKKNMSLHKKIFDNLSDALAVIALLVILVFAGLVYLILNPDKVQEAKSYFQSGMNKVEPVISAEKIIINDINSSNSLNDFKNKIVASFSNDSATMNDTLIIQHGAITSDTSRPELSKIGDKIRIDSFEVVLNSCQITDRLQIGGNTVSPETDPTAKNLLIVNVSYRNISNENLQPPEGEASIKFEASEHMLKEKPIDAPGWEPITENVEQIILKKTNLVYEIPNDLITNPIYWEPDVDSASEKFICDTVIYAKNLNFKVSGEVSDSEQ
jgi:hypothetical protein